MARRGPKPKQKPTAPPDGGPLWAGFDLPADLPEPARDEVARLVRALAAVGTLGRTDPRLVLAAARVGTLVDQATAAVERDGLTILAGNGTECRHPLLSTLNTLTMRLRGLWSDMGLTPATAKLGSDAKAETAANPWDGLLGIHAS